MKIFEFVIKLEGLTKSKLAKVEHNGSLDADSIETAAQEAIQLANKLSGEFTKCTLILEEKSGHI